MLSSVASCWLSTSTTLGRSPATRATYQDQEDVAILGYVVNQHRVEAAHCAIGKRQVEQGPMHRVLVQDAVTVGCDPITRIRTMRESRPVGLGGQEVHPEGAVGSR